MQVNVGIRLQSLTSLSPWRPTRKIFVSYRRVDTEALAERLYEGLSLQFGASNVFLDVPDIEPGQRWRDEVGAQLRAADIVIALIGPRWLETLKAKEAGDDVLRTELASALAQKKQIVPILVGDARMPEPALLPPDVRDLADFQALAISPDHLERGLPELLGHLKPGVGLAIAWALVAGFGWLVGVIAAVVAFGVIEGDRQIPEGAGRTLFASLVAGTLLGLSMGGLQWLVLRPWFRRARFLAPFYALSSAIAFAFAAKSDVLAVLVLLLLPVGFAITLWVVVHKQLTYAGWWSAVNAVAPFAGILLTGPQNPQAPATVQRAANAPTPSLLLMLLPTIASGFLLVWLMRRSQIKRR